MSTASK